MVFLSNVRFGKRNNDVKSVQSALVAAGFSLPAGVTGIYEGQTRSAYAAWQRSLGLTGSDADGFPGCSSLTRLGRKSGFGVDCRQPGAISTSSVRFSKNSAMPNNEATARGFAEQVCTMTGAPSSWITGVSNHANLLTLMFRESSFNSNAVNPHDVNATGAVQSDGAHFNCSRGYAQVTAVTFAENHEEGTSHLIYDPLANIAAAINYIWRRYGDISRVQQANPNLPPHPY